MLNSQKNEAFIEGILSEIDLKDIESSKDGVPYKAIGGTIKIHVPTDTTTLEIPVRMFAKQYKNDGAPNPAYESVRKVRDEMVSIAASDENHADRIRISKAQITMQEYYNQNGNLVSYPSLSATFVSKVPADKFNPKAEFAVVFVVAEAGMETDAEGIETGRYKMRGILPQYGGRVDVVPFIASNEGVISAISQYWSVGDTVSAIGKLNFTSRTETISVPCDFGEPRQETRTVTVSDLVITGGSSAPLEGELAYDANEIKAAVAARQARLLELKDKPRTPKATPAAKSTTSFDLGF